jgi:hypothetical protein
MEMEAGLPEVDSPAERLDRFCAELITFLNQTSHYLPVAEDRPRLSRAADELRATQQEVFGKELATLEEDGSLRRAGLAGDQLDFKIATVTRDMNAVGHPPRGLLAGPRRGRRSKKILRALGKAKVVIGSLKSLSKWFEALGELVEMAEKALER